MLLMSEITVAWQQCCTASSWTAMQGADLLACQARHDAAGGAFQYFWCRIRHIRLWRSTPVIGYHLQAVFL
jgi:hypothetical protein